MEFDQEAIHRLAPQHRIEVQEHYVKVFNYKKRPPHVPERRKPKTWARPWPKPWPRPQTWGDPETRLKRLEAKRSRAFSPRKKK